MLATPVPVGTATRIEKRLKSQGTKIAVVSQPIFVTDGCAVEDFNWPDRIVLGVAFGIAAICAILQSVATSGDLDVGHHIYLLVALIALILGVLIAVQTERVRMATK